MTNSADAVAGQGEQAHTEASYRSLFEHLPVGAYRTAVHGRILEVNPAFARMVGYSVDELLELNARDLYRDPSWRGEWIDRLSESDETHLGELDLIHRDGSVVHIRLHTRLMRDADGTPVAVEGVAEDITALRRRASLRGVTDGAFSAVFEHAPIGMVLLSPDGVFQSVNRAYGALIGRDPESLVGVSVATVTHPDDVGETVRQLQVAVSGADAPIEFDKRYVRPDGGDVWVRVHLSPVFDTTSQLQYLVGQIVDTSKQRSDRAALEELVRSKDEFIATISHELRTPLTVVHGLAHELRDHMDRFGQQELEDLVGLMAAQSREVSGLVEDLLVAARADHGTLTVRVAAFDVVPEIQAALESVPAVPAPRVTDAPAGARVLADPLRLRQILRNLFTNVERYGGDLLAVSVSETDAVITIDVADDGPGVADEEVERIFDAYQRAHDLGGRPAAVGLGLTVSRTLARLMRGDLVYLREGGMSVFRLTLPSVVDAEKPAGTA